MNETLLFTIITLCAIGVFAAIILYYVAQKFKVYEDPRIDEVEKMLPGANCGGCGYPGCRGFADAMVANDDISALYCNVAGADLMGQIATHLGKATPIKEAQVAVVKCNGSCTNRKRTNSYDGTQSCAIQASLYGGETACSFGCLGCGDCVTVCDFGAIKIDKKTLLPVIDDKLCTACGSCVTACPKTIIELRKKAPRRKKIFVSCSNYDKGGVARKACDAACIGCGKCVKVCPFDAITIDKNLAYIDSFKCKLCRKCVAECPTKAIVEVGFPAPRPKPPVSETTGQATGQATSKVTEQAAVLETTKQSTVDINTSANDTPIA